MSNCLFLQLKTQQIINRVQTGTKAVSNWHGGNLDPDSVSKHQHLLKRAGYKSHSDAKGIF